MSMKGLKWGRSHSEGRGPNQGPPDLDELWRDFNRRLSNLMGNKGRPGWNGDGNSGGPGRNNLDPRLFSGGLSLLIGIVVLAWFSSGFYVVDAAERGVVLQFGKFKEITEPGLRWHLPVPIESHELVQLNAVRTKEVGYRGRSTVLKEALMLTDDENIVNIQFAVQYLLKDPVDFLFQNRDADDAVMQVAETAMREIVGKSKMDFVLYEGREQIAASANKLMQDILDRYRTGVIVSKVTMQNAQAPEQVQAAFDDAVKAGQDRERKKNEGEAYANDVIPGAKGTAARLLEEAQAYKQSLIARAEGDASRFHQLQVEYAKAPEVTRQRLYLETMQQIYSKTTKVMVDGKGGQGGSLLYLPLDKLMQVNQSQTAGGAPATPAPPTGAETPATNISVARPSAISNETPPQLENSGARGDNRSRDAVRTRDRDSR